MPMVKIGAVMSKDVLTANKEDTVMSMLERLQKHRMGAIVVINKDDVPVGIITERDIIQALVIYKQETFEKQAQDIMSAPVLTLDPEQDIDSAAILMTLNGIRRIPITKENKLIGLITYRDITNALRKSYYVLEEKAQMLQDMANRDSLTKLFNKRLINEEIKKQFDAAKESNSPMAVIMIDIDHFKKINDTYGHPCGDYVLKTLSSILLSKSRDINIVGRYGGDEFIVLGAISDHKSSLYFAERLRMIIESTPFLYENQELKITISTGVCVWNSKIKDAKTMIKLADGALYNAKQAGRNCVKMAEVL
ncbi:MAG: GGDEF domain-containing protein [bacterium]